MSGVVTSRRKRGRPAVTWLDADAVAARLGVPGLSGAVVSGLLSRAPLFLPGAVRNDRNEWRVRGDLLARLLDGDDSGRALPLLEQLGGLSLRTIGELLGCDAEALARHKAWRAVIHDVPGVGLRVSVADYLKLRGGKQV